MTTKIEWCDAVWNPVTGCSHVSEGCRYCYAEREFPRLANGLKVPAYQGRTFTDVACHPERLDEPLKRKKPTRYFVNSMSDLFHERVHISFIRTVYETMARCPQHEFLILTKRPKQALYFYQRIAVQSGEFYTPPREEDLAGAFKAFMGRPWPLPNVWLGVSVEGQKTADERVPILLQCPAAIRWVSYEPALGPVDFAPWLPGFCNSCGEHLTGINKEMMTCSHCEWISEPPWLQWCVCGGESGPNARPSDPDWFRRVRDDCIAAGVPFFFKQWGEWGPTESEEYPVTVMHRVGKKRAGRKLDGVEWNQFPEVR